MKIHLTILISLLIGTSNYASIRYVTESGAGAMDGSSWSNAFPGTSLQAAIDASGTNDEVWVACGAYKTTTGTNRSIAFSMKNNVVIYGSFIGTETALSQRNLSCGPCSVLSGEIGLPGPTDNSYKVIRNQALFSSAGIDGFIIRDGYDERAPTLTDGLGGGIINIGSGPGNVCSPTISNCVITNNQSEFGAGIFNDGYNGGNASPYIYNCIITNNLATGGGGGIDNFGLSGNASPFIWNCVIAHNTAQDAAGGMYCWGGSGGNASPILYNTVVANNNVILGFGGGIIADRSNGGGGAGGGSGSANVIAFSCIIYENIANTGPQFFTYENGAVMANYSDIDSTGQFAPHVSQGTNSGNIAADPLFINSLLPIGADSCWMTDDDGYQLQTGSPCINTGDSASAVGPDLAFNDRITGTNIDMGAYEYAGSTGVQTEENLRVNIYPNPVNDQLHIISICDDEVLIINSIGEVVKKMDILWGLRSITVTDLKPGFYYLYFIHQKFTEKMIKL